MSTNLLLPRSRPEAAPRGDSAEELPAQRGSGRGSDYGPDPTRLVFWLLLAAFALAIVAGLAIPETVGRDGGWRRALRPQVAVPRQMRAAFVAAIPCRAATWALGGLALSLGGSLTAGVLGETSHLAGALPIFLMTGISAVVSVPLRDTPAGATARGGLVALIAGAGLALAALGLESRVLFLAGCAAAGLGFGPAFAGVFRVLSGLALAHQRAALISSVLTVSYLAFSLPAIAAGAAVTDLRLRETAEIYGGVLIALAALALPLSARLDDSPAGPLTEEATPSVAAFAACAEGCRG
jgi:hypothetical protein